MALTNTQLNRLDGITKLYVDDKVSNISYNYYTTNSTYTLSPSDYIVEVTATASIYLPTNSVSGKQYIIKNTSPDTITIVGSIDNVSSFLIYEEECITLVYNGTKYLIVSYYIP